MIAKVYRKFRIGSKRVRFSSQGHSYAVWENDTVPRIPDNLRDCVVYLFPTLQDAKEGNRLGGSGFVAGVDYTNNPILCHGYLVTNAHVVENSIAARKSMFARINLSSGGFDTVEIDHSSWKLGENGDDLAVCALNAPDKIFKVAVVPEDMFVPEPLEQMAGRTDLVGLGDDVFMIGRYVDHQGKVRNLPTVRFGNIAQMPDEPIRQPQRGHAQKSFLVEMRSFSGFSGSPVFLIEEWGTPRPHIHLLGVDWGHLPLRGRLVNKQGEQRTDDFPEIDSMMSGVIPAWLLRAILHDPQFVQQRRRDEEAEAAGQIHGAVLDTSHDEDEDEEDENQIAKRVVDHSSNPS